MKLKSNLFNAIFITVGLCMMLLFTVFLIPALAQSGEEKVTIDQVPTEVKSAILKEVGDGRLVDIGEFTEEGKKLYEIEMVVDGKEFDVLFSSDGKVLRKTFEGLKTRVDKEEKKTVDKTDKFQDFFDLENRDFASTGRNKYFILEPGYQLVLEGKEEEHTVKLVINVLDETKKIGRVETRVVEEIETVDGQLIEISRNFFAICKQTKSVFYFGEEVDVYKNGKIVAHEGAWIHGKNNAHAGIMMPGDPLLGAKYYQEVAPKVAMDRANIVDVNAILKTPAGEFKGCLKIQEENPLDKEKEFKIHAPGIGLIQDEDLLLTKYSKAKAREEKVSLEDLPPAVRAAIEKHAEGGKVKEIEKEMKKGAFVYEAKVLKDGKEFDLLISATGKFLCKEAEEETKHHHEKECDKDDDDEGHDKDEDN